jgi:predicted RNase H-like nuclease (RuvC/YqgF family)
MVRHSQYKEIEHAQYAAQYSDKRTHAAEVSELKAENEELKKQIIILQAQVKVLEEQLDRYDGELF